MRINSTNSVHTANAVSRTAPPRPAREAVASRRSDRLALSDDLGQMRRAHAAASEAPDVRAKRVAEIKAQVQAGTYQVDTDALAGKMLSHH